MQITATSPANNGRSKIDISTDFFTPNLQQDEYTVALTNGTVASGSAASANHPGQMACTLPATSASLVSVYASPITLGQGGELAETVIQTAAALPATLTQRFGIASGLGTTTAPANGAYMEIVGTTLSCKTAVGSTATTAGTTFTVAVSTWYHLRITFVTATSVLFEVYSDAGALLFSTTMTAPTGTPQAGTGYVCFQNVLGTAQVAATLDYIGFKINRTISRGAP